MVAHSSEGLDELSIAASSKVAELRGGEVSEYEIVPEELGLERHDLSQLMVEDVEQSLVMVREALSDADSPAGQMVALNAGAAIYVSGVADSHKQGVEMAIDAISIGLAKNKLSELADFTAQLKELEGS